MKYYAYLKQKGEGCDYTIGCGQLLTTLEAKSDDDAREKLASLVKEEYQGEFELSSVLLFKEPISFNLKDVYDKSKASKEEETTKRQHIKDMDEFEKLKKKLGK